MSDNNENTIEVIANAMHQLNVAGEMLHMIARDKGDQMVRHVAGMIDDVHNDLDILQSAISSDDQ